MFLTRPRFWTFVLAAAALAGCGAGDLSRPAPQIGDVALGYAIVVADNAKMAGPSREASPEEWETAVRDAVVARIGRQEGGKLYHLGIGIDAYALAIPGIPVVLAPKSAIVAQVTLWDDAAQVKVNPEPERLTVLEQLSAETVVSSGLTQSREQQIENLSVALAGAIERWMVRNKDWFAIEAVAERALQAERTAFEGRLAAGEIAAGTESGALAELLLPPDETEAEDVAEAAEPPGN